mgnify:CR=1 FL=1
MHGRSAQFHPSPALPSLCPVPGAWSVRNARLQTTSLPGSQRCLGTVTPALHQPRSLALTLQIECWGLGIRCTLRTTPTCPLQCPIAPSLFPVPSFLCPALHRRRG